MNQGSVDAAVYNALVTGAGTALAAHVGGTAAPRVYFKQAPAKAPVPYVVFDMWGGGDDNDNPARSFNVVYRIECIDTDAASADTGAALIDAALHARTLTISGVTNFWTARESWFSGINNVEGKQWWRRGGFYRFRASE